MSAKISPEGRRFAVSRIDDGLYKIWIYALEPPSLEKLATERNSFYPLWTPDGARLIYRSTRNTKLEILSKSLDVFGEEKSIIEDITIDREVNALSPDGRWLAFAIYPQGQGIDLALLELRTGAPPITVVSSPFVDDLASFSRDSSWLGFSSNISGQWEVFAQPVEGDAPRVKISTDGGDFSLWSRMRDELYYQRDDTIMAVPYRFEAGRLRAGEPQRLAELPKGAFLQDISPDGEQFLVLVPTGEDPAPTELLVTLNWFEELKRLAPTN